jgi:hypothetical protein
MKFRLDGLHYSSDNVDIHLLFTRIQDEDLINKIHQFRKIDYNRSYVTIFHLSACTIV